MLVAQYALAAVVTLATAALLVARGRLAEVLGFIAARLPQWCLLARVGAGGGDVCGCVPESPKSRGASTVMPMTLLPRQPAKKLALHRPAAAAAREERPTLLRHRGPQYLAPEPDVSAEPQDWGVEPEGAALPAYAHGAVVECYSRALKRWLPGTVAVIVQDRPQEGAPAAVAYEVSVGRPRQLLRNVELDCLRDPLQVGEAVEVLLPRAAPRWSPGAVTAAHQSCGPLPATSFRVLAECEGADLEMSGVQPEQVRRRFPEGAAVDVYRGPTHGWVAAVVCSSADWEPAQEPPSPSVSVLLSKAAHAHSGTGSSGFDSVPAHLVRPRRQQA